MVQITARAHRQTFGDPPHRHRRLRPQAGRNALPLGESGSGFPGIPVGHGVGQVDVGAVSGRSGDRFVRIENPPNADRAPGLPSSPGIGLAGLGPPKCPPEPIAPSSSTRSIEIRQPQSAGLHFRTARTLRRGHGLSWLLSAPVTHRHHPSAPHIQRPRLQMLHRHKPLQPRLRRIAGLSSVLHHVPKAHTLPARALEERKRGPGGVGMEVWKIWDHEFHDWSRMCLARTALPRAVSR